MADVGDAVAGAAAPSVLVVGAGPIGLEAAVACRLAGLAVTVVERGVTIAAGVRDWQHVRLFSSNELNVSAYGCKALMELGHPNPVPTVCPSGAEYIDKYLEPMSRWLLEQPGCAIWLGTSVDSISRGSLLKGEAIKGVGATERDTAPFIVLTTDSDGQESVTEFTAVIDCSGTYGNGNWLGPGGAPAIGERMLRVEASSKAREGATCDFFFNRIPDVVGKDVSSFLPRAGARVRSVAVVGGGYSAATTIRSLLDLSASRANTFTLEIDWFLRKPRAAGAPYDEQEDDPLPSRGKLVHLANAIASSVDGGGGGPGPSPVIRVHRGVTIKRLSRDAATGRFIIQGERDGPEPEPAAARPAEDMNAPVSAPGDERGPAAAPAIAGEEGTDSPGVDAVNAEEDVQAVETGASPTSTKGSNPPEDFELSTDTVVSLVGYRPSYEMARELQVHLCYASEGPMKLASSMLAARVAALSNGDAAAVSDCLKQPPPGPELLTTPEPRFFVLGSKSYGRASNFLLSIGHRQVEAVVGLLQADLLPSTPDAEAGSASPTENASAPAAQQNEPSHGQEGGRGVEGVPASKPEDAQLTEADGNEPVIDAQGEAPTAVP